MVWYSLERSKLLIVGRFYAKLFSVRYLDQKATNRQIRFFFQTFANIFYFCLLFELFVVQKTITFVRNLPNISDKVYV